MAIAQSTARITLVGRAPVDTVGRVTIGREVRNVAGRFIEVLDDPQLSKMHACIEVVNGVPMVIDLGSTNGTFLLDANGRNRVPYDYWVALPPGSRLELGDQIVDVQVFHPASDPYEPPPAAPTGGDPRRVLIAALAAVALLLTLAFGWLVVTGRDGDQTSRADERAEQDERDERERDEQEAQDDGAGTDEAPVGDGRLGESARPTVDQRATLVDAPVAAQWSWDTRGARDRSAAVVDDLVYVVTIEAGLVTAVGLARADGTERWSSVLAESADEVDVVGDVGDVVIVEVCDEECTVFAIDAAGTQRWSAPSRENGTFVTNSRLYFFTEVGAELIDPGSGAAVRSVTADFVTLWRPRPVAIVDDPSEFTVYDFDLRPVVGPVGFDPDAVVYGDLNGAAVVLADDRELTLSDEQGELDGRTVAIDPDGAVVEVIMVEPDLVVVETFDGSIHGFDTSGDVADEIWQRASSVGLDDVTSTDAGPVLVVDLGDDGAEFLDARTGEVRVSLSDPSIAHSMRFGRNALGVVYYDFPADTSEVVLFNWSTGRELLRQELDGLVAVVDGGLIALADGEVVYYE